MRDPSFEAFGEELRRRGSASGWNLVVVRRTDSSNQLARRVSREFTMEGLEVPAAAVVAYEQTAGRGRLGRSWQSPPGGGIYASLLLPAPPPPELSALPLVVPLALCRALEPHLSQPCRLKWPNDLLVAGRKIAGVLVEAVLRADGTGEAIVGFGVNHLAPPAPMAGAAVTSVAHESDRLPPLATLAWELLWTVGEALRSPPATAVAVREYLQRSVHQAGDRMHCRTADRSVAGRFLGLTDEGFLRLEVDGEEEVVSSGEVVEA